ncbi:MAG: hypothetical protein ACJ735_04605 [Actinomycetes bacterium]
MMKELRDQATGKVVVTAASIASDPVGTARGLASTGAKTAIRLPVRAGVAATGPAIGIVSRALAVAGSALRTGRQLRERVRPGQRTNGVAVPPPPRPATQERRPEQPAPAADAVTPAATETQEELPEAAVIAGAPGAADAAVARAERAVAGSLAVDATPSHDELPLADYDHLTLPALRARLTRIDLTGLMQLRNYEKAHANRLPVVTMLENRIAKVTTSNGN